MTRISNQAEFFIFLLEKYAEYKSLPAGEMLNLWQEHGLVDYINAMYEQYHTERIENTFADINRKLAKKQLQQQNKTNKL
jgi:ATP-dependent RNA circularization protein (DNA/RNA ligase family)